MKKLFAGIVMMFMLAFGIAGSTTAPVYAGSPIDAAKSQVCTGVNSQAGAACGGGGVELSRILKAVLSILSIIAGVIAVFMIIISGMKYITSSGDAQAVSSAKRTLIYAIVGLVVVAVSQLIVRFVLTNTK